ncbi:hypothetical protein MNBD_GAMMA07-2742 [hydrothermal vent metagenome]|uniref:Roadblock/LAMTOR2 domain-containing protein n=1 Tax=hydrothermal vent metagenome TaxID=652676 RepID=A0A3B0WK56_9ZZZZ
MISQNIEQDKLINPGNEISTGGTEDLYVILEDMNSACRDIQLSMLTTADGLIMTAVGTVLDPGQVGAMCTELITVCHKAAKQLEQGELEQMIIRCSEGCMFLMPAGEFAVLAIMCVPDINLGLLILEAQRSASLIQNSL